MFLIYLLIAIVGFSGVVFGFWGQQHLKQPYDTMAAFCLPFGLVLGLLGVLLICVPNFFS